MTHRSPAETWLSKNLTLSVIVTIAGGAMALVAGWSTLQSRMGVLDEKYQIMHGQMQRIGDQNIPYRVTVIEQQMQNTQQRIDRVSETIAVSLDAIRKDLGQMNTGLELLRQKLETIVPARKAEFEPPPGQPGQKAR